MTAGENDRHEAEEEASSTNFLHNSHWIKDPHHSGPSRYVGYYDAASLYPSSSEFFSPIYFFVLTVLHRGGGGQVLKKFLNQAKYTQKNKNKTLGECDSESCCLRQLCGGFYLKAGR